MAASANSYYGHKQILATYAGLRRPRPILGYLLHGWHPWFPWMPDAEVILSSVPRGLPIFAWSERDRRMLVEAGARRVVSIGAPFLYLLEMRGEPEPADPRSLVAFPFHTITRAGFENVWEEYARHLETLEGFDRVTVCLYPNDFDSPEVRSCFERRGFETTTNGLYHDPSFLHRFYELVGDHGAATSNRISTALVYAASMGRAVRLSGPTPAVTFQQTAGEIRDEGRRTVEFQRERFPELIAGLSPTDALQFGRAELGADQMKSPPDLRRTLGWSGPKAPLGFGVALAAGARRRLRRQPREASGAGGRGRASSGPQAARGRL
jgi:hypothetical protein